jgi:hypothetical protein
MAHQYTLGDEVEIHVNDAVGWVKGVVDYADGHGSFIVATEKHKRFTFSDSKHPDLRKPQKR